MDRRPSPSRSLPTRAGLAGFGTVAAALVFGLQPRTAASSRPSLPVPYARSLPARPVPARPVLDPARSFVQVDTALITNDGQSVRISVTLRDLAWRPLVGEPVALLPSRRFMVGATGRTGRDGRVTLVSVVAAGARHQQGSAGPVLLPVRDLRAGVVLPDVPQLIVYNRVAVLVQGLGTNLHCRDTACLPGMFGPLVAAVLRPLGYGAGGTPTILSYSYRGGQMALLDGNWRWRPREYDRCDTIQRVEGSAGSLRTMLLGYRARYPYTTFELIGHSLGGLVAFQAAGYRAFLGKIGPAGIDKLVTIDSPVNGITGFRARTWLVDALAGQWQLRGCSGQRWGLPLLAELRGIGGRAPIRQHQWAAALRAARTAVLTVTNSADIPVPESYAIVDDGQRRSVVDRLRFTNSSGADLGHSGLLYPSAGHGHRNPAWPAFTGRIRAYLAQPCLAFAPIGSACRYPSMDGDF